MTPRTIHYVWMGGAPKPPIVCHCIESWHRFCPGWEFKEWNDASMHDVGNRYACEAYAYGKWAFVADWMRLNAIYRYGGIYLDTDMELLKPIDTFLENNLTLGLACVNGKTVFDTGIMGCRKGDKFIGGFLNEYEDIPFVLPNGELDQTPNTERMIVYSAKNWNICPVSADATIDMGDGRMIYSAEFFRSRTGYSFHHCCASWLDDWFRKVWLSAGSYKLVRFKRRLQAMSPMPTLRQGERALFSFPMGNRKRIILVKRDNKV